MKFRVTGLSSPPSIFRTRPCSTVTSRVQASGQSSGHAVRTVECPQVSGAVACPERAERAEGVRAMADYTGGHDLFRVQLADGLLDVRAFPAGTHVDAG